MKTMLLRRFGQIYRYNIGWLDIRVSWSKLVGAQDIPSRTSRWVYIRVQSKMKKVLGVQNSIPQAKKLFGAPPIFGREVMPH